MFKTHNLDGSMQNETFASQFADYKDGLILRLLLRDHSSLNKVDEIKFSDNELLMKFDN